MRWTRAQRETIETRGKNILVSAAAGSGKTTVLIERIRRLILEDRVDIDRFLITTFTNAAAAEMKEKMEKSIHGQLEESRAAGEDISWLQRQLDLLPQASISTFHTFAIGIMRDFFYLTDLAPGFQIGDETRLAIMRKEAVDEVFERRFDQNTDEFRTFLRRHSRDRSDERLKEQVLDVYGKLRSVPRYMDWARARADLMKSDHPARALGIDLFLLEETADALKDAANWFGAAADVMKQPETETIWMKARQDAERLSQMGEKAASAAREGNAEALTELREMLFDFKPNTMRAGKDEKPFYDELKDQVDWLRKQGKRSLDNLKKKYYTQMPEEWDRVLRAGADDTAYFIDLIGETETIYKERKQEKNLVDFDDCMHYAIEILENEAAAAEYRDRFRYIFIDEYQDSNLLQEEIVGRIARADNLFMVGDVKQSIYKFRLAEPEIFRDRYELYRSGADENSVRIDLNSNFRSRSTIRNAVNRIFETIMDGYDEDARLNGPEEEPGEKGFPVELFIVDSGEQAEDGDPESGESTAIEPVTELDVIASVIRDSIGRPIVERDGSTRPIGYGDIAVLSRGRDLIPQIERYLNNEGIPAFGETAGGYYETVEIQVFLNLLKVISNFCQDVPLISAMSSVVFDFSPQQLAQIRIEFREGSYWQAVRRYETEGQAPLIRGKISAMLRQFALWKEIARTVPLDELMRMLLYDTGYYDYCNGLPTGDRRVSNLRLLLEKAASFEESSYMGLHGFLSYVEAMRRSRQSVSEALPANEGRSVVQVMTVHKSKGLEFPVVIFAGAGKQLRGASDGKSPVMHKDFGIGLQESDPEHHWSRKTILQKAIAGKKTREGLEEEIRILYVALTRPMQRLVITGAHKEPDKLQRFAGRGSFLEMIFGTLSEMEEEDPSAAQVHVCRSIDYLAQWEAEAKTSGMEVDLGGDAPAGDAGAAASCDTAVAAGSEEAAEFAGVEGRVPDDFAEAVAIGADNIPDAAEIDRRLSFVYPYRKEMQVRSKYSVTELNRRAGQRSAEGSQEPGQEEARVEIVNRIPELADLKEVGTASEGPIRLTAAQIGTAMHTVMERISFPRALEEGIPYIENSAEELHAQGILTDEEYGAVRPEDIYGFFCSDVGARAAKAPALHREKEFLLHREVEGVPAVVQGIIDCWFEDEQGIVLIDYKNSWAASASNETEIIERYAGQIRLYREALTEATGRKVSESWIYLFRSRKFVAVEMEQNQ